MKNLNNIPKNMEGVEVKSYDTDGQYYESHYSEDCYKVNYRALKREGSITSSTVNTNEKLKIIDLLEEKGFKKSIWEGETTLSKTCDKGPIEFDTETSKLLLGDSMESFVIKIDSVWHLTSVFLALGI